MKIKSVERPAAAAIMFLLLGCNAENKSQSLVGVDEKYQIESEASSRHEVTSGGQFAPLPRGNNLQDTVKELRLRAQRGDARAACQLAAELDFCADAERRMSSLSRAIAVMKASPGDNPAKQRGLDELHNSIIESRQYCTAIYSSPQERIANWRLAATRGHVPSMLHYASGAGFGRDDLLSTLDEMKTYRRIAPGLMERVAATGNLDAHLMLGRAYAPNWSGPDDTPLFRQSVQTKDAAKALAHFLVARQLVDTEGEAVVHEARMVEIEISTIKAGMSPAEITEGEQKARELRSSMRQAGEVRLPATGWNEREQYASKPSIDRCDQRAFLK
jgi:hypothetical protein